MEPKSDKPIADKVPNSLHHWQSAEDNEPQSPEVNPNAVHHMGWGRLIFAHTFDDAAGVANALLEEQSQERDIAIYLRDPHVVLSKAPHHLFLDPSHSYRLSFDEDPDLAMTPQGFFIREVRSVGDEEAVNRIYAENGMVQVPADFMLKARHNECIHHWVAIDDNSGEVLGTVTGVDHLEAIADPEQGSSLWCLSVSPAARYPGIGRCLVAHVAAFFRERGRSFMDLSVMHDNQNAIKLYASMGFKRVPVFVIKRKNPINEPLFTAPKQDDQLNPYAKIIVREARRRGIAVKIIDAPFGLFTLTLGGTSIRCRESLTDLTTAVVMSTCDDKRLTHLLLGKAGLKVPTQQPAGAPEDNRKFLDACESLVVKPARGEQGAGIAVDVRTPEELESAIAAAREHCPNVLLERYVSGHDLRIVVIDHEVVAAAMRVPPQVTGTGRHSITKLIEKQSRRRQAATDGESSIPLDAETKRCVEAAGHQLEDVLPAGETIAVRKTANLHTGGILKDVTEILHPDLASAAIRAAEALRIPVTGLDFIINEPTQPDYVIIEANERPGLANHEPQPTAERFIDMLFPQTAETPPSKRDTQ